MSYEEIILDSATAFQSATKYPATDTPIFGLGAGIGKIKSIKVLEVTFPYSWYNISGETSTYTGNDQLDNVQVFPGRTVWAASGHQEHSIFFYNPSTAFPHTTLRVKLPAGDGSAQTIVAYLNTYLNTAPALADLSTLSGLTVNSVTITYNTGPETISWEIAHNFVILTASKLGIAFRDPNVSDYGACFGMLAWGHPYRENPFLFTSLKHYYTSSFCNATPFKYVLLNSNAIGSYFPLNQNYSTKVAGNTFGYDITGVSQAMACIPLTENYKGIITYNDPDPDSKFAEFDNLLQKFDLYLTLGPWQQPLILNNQSFQVKIGITRDNGVGSNKRKMGF